MEVPKFLKLKDDALIFNEEGELLYYIPENYFTDVKQHPIAEVYGAYVSMVGIFDWALVTPNGKVGEAHPFKFPTIVMCKPSRIEKAKGVKLQEHFKPTDYRILHFKKGDEAITSINIPMIIDNAETVFGMMNVSGGKIPQSVPYDHIHEYPPEALSLNAKGYGLNAQLFGIMESELCRNPSDLTQPYRYTKMEKMTGYRQVSVKNLPMYISPYVALTNENFDESIMSAVLLSDQDEIKESPLEKVLMM